MRLRYLRATNFLSHEHEEVSFPAQGMFVLAGESGFGKSSFIVDAVGYALFGAVATRSKQANLVHKDFPGQPMSVAAMFEFDDGGRISIERGVDERGSSWARAYAPSQADPDEQVLLEEGAKPVARLVKKQLGGMTWQQFYSAFVARQKEISHLTNLRGGDRKQLVHRMLGMRELEKATQLVADRLRRQNAELTQLTRELGERDIDTERARLDEIDADVTQQIQALATAEADLQSSRTELEASRKLLTPMEVKAASQDRAEQLETGLAARRIERESIADRVRRHLEASTVVNDEAGLRERQAEAESRRLELRDVFARSQEHLRQSEQVAALSEQVNESRMKLQTPALQPAGAVTEAELGPPTAESLRTRRELLRSEVGHLRTERSERDEELKRLVESGECFTCLRTLGEGHDHDRVLENLQAKIDEIDATVAKSEAEIVQIEEALPAAESHDKAKAELETVKAQLSELEQGEIAEDLDALAREGKELAAAVASLSEELGRVQSSRKDLDPQAEERLAKLDELIAADEAALAKAQAEAEGADVDEITRLRDLISSRQAAVSQAEGRVPEMKRAVERAQKSASEARSEFDRFAEKYSSHDDRRQRALRLEQLQTYLRGYQKRLAQEIRPALEEIGSEMINQVSGGRHTAMRIDDDYEITVETSSGAWLNASALSGGEEIRANICLRLALTRLVSARTGVPLRLLVFDEPLPAQDPGHVERIMELLNSLRAFYSQQFIISHVGDLRNDDNVDYVLDFNRATGRDRISLVHA